jgi:hypothetical protein
MNLYAAVEPAEIGAIVLCFFIFVVVPLTFILLQHQRRMAEFFHGGKGLSQRLAEQVDRLQAEVSELRSRVGDLVLRVDDHERNLRQLPGEDSLTQRKLEG